jgi:hypothetical protein
MHAVLLRLLFPSWAFFDRVTEVPRLELQTFDERGGPSSWREALTAPPRTPLALVYHPHGTAHLAQQSAVERFAVGAERQEFDAVARDVVAAIARRALSPATATSWRWRVVAVDHTALSVPRVLFESDVQFVDTGAAVRDGGVA